MSVWLVEISWDVVLLNTETPSLSKVGDGMVVGCTFNVRDSFAATVNFAMQMDMKITAEPGPVYEYVAEQQLYDQSATGLFPYYGALSNGLAEATGNNGHAFRAGPIHLVASFDDTFQNIGFTGPLGTQIFPFVSFGLGPGPLVEVDLVELALSYRDFDGSEDVLVEVALYNWYVSVDGVRTKGAQLGTLQPGQWALGSVWHVASPFPGVSGVDTPQETRALEALAFTIGGAAPGVATWLRAWDITATGLGDIETLLALRCFHESGRLIYARVIKQAVDAIEVGVSSDRGHTWTTVMVGQVEGRFYQSPSLAEAPDGSFNLFVQDRSTPANVYWFRSDAEGLAWENFGFLLSVIPWITSSHPKVFTLFNGFFLVSYNRIGHWFLAVYDGGTGASFGLSTTDMGAVAGDVYPGLHEDALGNSYAIHGGLLERLSRSEDFGVDWVDIYDTPLGSNFVQTASSRFSPYIWKVWLDAVNNLIGACATDGGGTYLHGAVTIIAGLTQQVVGLAILPLGWAIEVHQVYNPSTDHWDIAGFHTSDLSVTWQGN